MVCVAPSPHPTAGGAMTVPAVAAKTESATAGAERFD